MEPLLKFDKVKFDELLDASVGALRCVKVR